jgi:alpha-L-arabinofuranosidase
MEKNIGKLKKEKPLSINGIRIFSPSGSRLLANFWFRVFEYFQLAEDLGAASSNFKLWNCLQFNTAEFVQMEDLEPYVQDALDLIEFANGDAKTTKWGALRAEMGHQKSLI